MLSKIDVILNRAAQELDPIDQVVEWFRELDPSTRNEVLGRLKYFCLQSHPLPSEMDIAITISQVKATMTPCVILKSKNLSEAIQKIVKLPESEQAKSFRLLLSLLSVADGRRRKTKCADGCTHEWHNLD